MGIEPTRSLFPNPSPVLKTGAGTSRTRTPIHVWNSSDSMVSVGRPIIIAGHRWVNPADEGLKVETPEIGPLGFAQDHRPPWPVYHSRCELMHRPGCRLDHRDGAGADIPASFRRNGTGPANSPNAF
jgi:hypothetical protein